MRPMVWDMVVIWARAISTSVWYCLAIACFRAKVAPRNWCACSGEMGLDKLDLTLLRRCLEFERYQFQLRVDWLYYVMRQDLNILGFHSELLLDYQKTSTTTSSHSHLCQCLQQSCRPLRVCSASARRRLVRQNPRRTIKNRLRSDQL